ncbi:MAG: hypothetical protein PHG63_02980 [Candidatus Dojkabacteria bacterium]|nr:hypothetical protein [Candidatus Dojkabacteria bacterium]
MAIAVLIKKWKHKTFFPDQKPEFEKKRNRIASWFLVLGTIAGVILGLVFLLTDITVPQYVSIDASVHFLLGKKLLIDEQLQYFSRTIFFPDSPNIHTYPYGTAVITALFMRLTNFWDTLVSYQVFNCLLLGLVNGYGLFVLQKIFRIKRPAIAGLTFLLISLGFFLNLHIMGFTSQLMGLFFFYTFLDIYVSYKWSWWKAVVLGLLASAVLSTYVFWAIFLAAFVTLDQIIFLLGPGREQRRSHVPLIIIMAGTALLLSAHYTYMLVTSTFVQMNSTADGLAYKVLLADILIGLPFLVVYLMRSGKSFPNFKRNGLPLLVASTICTGILGMLFKTGFMQSYPFAKSFPLVIPLIYVASMKGLEIVINDAKRWGKALQWSMIVMIVWIITTPFFIVDSTFNYTHSLPIRFDDLDIQVYYLFFYNGQNFINGNVHPYNIGRSSAQFARNVRQYIPSDISKVSVVATGDHCLWFYTFSDVWTRDIPDQLLLWTPGILDYQAWLKDRSSNYLIILNDDQASSWIRDNDFEWKDYEVIYELDENYLLEYKGGTD